MGRNSPKISVGKTIRFKEYSSKRAPRITMSNADIFPNRHVSSIMHKTEDRTADGAEGSAEYDVS